jgi:integrase
MGVRQFAEELEGRKSMSEHCLPPGIRKHHGAYQVRYYGPDGRRHARRFERLTDAKKFKRDTETDRDRGLWIDPRGAKTRFGDWVQSYMGSKLNIRARTTDKYVSSLRAHLLPVFSEASLGAITRAWVQEWVTDLHRRGFAAETIRGHYDLLAAIMGRAVDEGLIAKTPCRNVKLPPIVRTEQRYLGESEVEALAGAHPVPYRALVYAATYLGPRWQELAGLRRAMVDMRPGRLATMRIVATIERSNGRYRPVEYGKSKAARRTLKMPEFLREMLAWHLSQFGSDEWVFPSPGGSFLRYDNFRKRVWLPAVERAGLAPLKFHELRHTAAAFMIDEGADPLLVKRRMGHEDIRTTYNLYGHLFPDREEALVAALDKRRATVVARNGDHAGTRAPEEVIELHGRRRSEQGF